MNEKKLRLLMMLIIVIGLGLIITGISLVIFTDIVTSKGVDGILTISGFIAGGLFISVSAKIYLTLHYMKYNSEKLKEKSRN